MATPEPVEDSTTDATNPRLRYCPLEPGEPIDADQCEYCPSHPKPPMTICALPRARLTPRPRGFWDKEVS